MLKIRLQRVGRKHEPVFRLVLTDSQNGPRSGKALEVLGSYDSRKGDKAEFQTDKIKEWMKQGVQLSPTVHNILVSKKVLEGKKVNVLPPSVIQNIKNKKLEDQKKEEEAKKEAEESAKTRLNDEVGQEAGQETKAAAEKAEAEAAAPAEEIAEVAEEVTPEAPAEVVEEAKSE